MGFLKYALIALLGGGTILAGGATFTKMGVEDMDHPQGISLRQDSVQTTRGRPPSFFTRYGSRSHAGGGLRGGK